ncbi:MAG TPA: peptidylprolyl isomerase [Anaerolineales bacterium]
MSGKQQTKRNARRAARARHRLITRIIGIVLVVLVVAVITFVIYSTLKKSITANQSPTGPNSFLTPGGPTPELVGTKQYASAPPLIIDVSKQYFATVQMEKGGEFVIQLYPEKAPITVNSFVFLAEQGFFDGVTFHRVMAGFMAQGGDPTGTGGGGPGYQLVNEGNDLKFDKAGVVAMANTGRNTNGSQFFITFGPAGLSENDFTIFGQVISGMDIVNNITLRDPTQNPGFTGDIIKSITITIK